MEGDPQLFGALPGNPRNCVLIIDNPADGVLGRVKIEIYMTGRRDPMRLVFDNLPSDRMATAIGYVIPLALQSHYVNTSQMRRHMWRVWRTVSYAGWEVGISGCGKEGTLRERAVK